jgi:hypothetical protein
MVRQAKAFVRIISAIGRRHWHDRAHDLLRRPAAVKTQ